MKIIRFLNDQDQLCFGHEFKNNHATLLKGRLFADLKNTGQTVRVKKILAPLEPAAILCTALNYHQHAIEAGFDLPRYPALFYKNPSALAHPGDPIIIPASCIDPPQVDYEAELAVVIGKAAKNVPQSKALDYVGGYTLANDISARRWQKHAGAGQFARSKSFDTFCPLGPELITPDDIPDPQSLQLSCVLNGKVMQDTSTSDMIFPVAEIISYLSTGMTLLPGSVLLTGTPSGVGFSRKPPVYLKAGDRVEVRIEGFMPLVNSVVYE